MPARRRRTTTLAALAAVTAAAALAIACGIDAVATKDGPIPGADTGDDRTVVLPPEGGPVIDGGPDVNLPDAHEAGCPTGHGDMVDVHDAGGLSFCIDSTEVTNTEYDKFVAATGAKVDSGLFDAGAPAACASNTSYSRGAVASDPLQFPAAKVDWCDAHDYCAWAGKRLCGRVTPDRDAASGEWFAACSSGGTKTYPYGPTYEAGACNDNSVVGNVTAVGAFPGCKGGFAGLTDMSGNVAEWVDSCAVDGTCAAAGSYFADTPAASTCKQSYDYGPGQAFPSVGFRCCADER